MVTVLITGASGFIGSFLVEEALKRGMEVWTGVRSTSSRAYLQDDRIHFIELDFAHPDKLLRQLADHLKNQHRFDYIIHCAGVTKCVDKKDFEQVNYLQTRCFVETLQKLEMAPRQFAFVSTLSVFGPIREKSYTPIQEKDIPCPNTAYGESKLKAEIYLQSLSNFPYVIYRPTGVYGPREKEYYLMVKALYRHVEFAVGFKRQDLTFIYVKDVVQAIFLGIEKQVRHRVYFLADGQVYPSHTFSELIRKELGNPFVVRITCPLCLLKVISLFAEWITKRRGKIGTLNSDKYNIMKQRNWQCDITPTIKELGFTPQYDLARGVKETIAWYKEKGWI